MSGFDSYSLCLDRPSMGVFTYAQNKHKAWSQIHVQEDYLKVVTKGVNKETGEVSTLYELLLLNDKEVD